MACIFEDLEQNIKNQSKYKGTITIIVNGTVVDRPTVTGGEAMMVITPDQSTAGPAFTPVATQQMVVLFNNWNGLDCEFTNQAKFPLSHASNVVQFNIWTFEQENSKSLPYSLSDGSGASIANGELTFDSCAPQAAARQFCQFSAKNFNRRLETGDYTLTVNNVKICQNADSAHNGFILVLGD